MSDIVDFTTEQLSELRLQLQASRAEIKAKMQEITRELDRRLAAEDITTKIKKIEQEHDVQILGPEGIASEEAIGGLVTR